MIFLFAFLVLVAPCPGASNPTPPNSSDSTTPSGSMTHRDSELLDNSTLPMQSNTSPSSPAHPTQPGQDSNLVRQPYQRHPSSRSAATQSQTNMIPSSSAHPTHPGQHDNMIHSPYFRHYPSPVTQSRTNTSSSSSARPAEPGQNDDRVPSPYFRNPSSESQSNSNPLIPVFQRPSQSTSTRVPWYHGNAFYAAGRASHGIPPNEFHIMDHLSSSVIQYVFAWGIGYASVRPNLNTSIYIQALLNHGALSLNLLANAVFPRTLPVLAFTLDRLSFLLIVISAYLASLPMFPPYVAIIMFLFVAIVYMVSHFRR
ncbi:hypothetical protein Bca52824_029163 [Brassica carinata]|uniref:Uncharacterized protein n=1 Tax=Brassica carinata TaxID=52824 RepID=A0A8X8APC2_BRACI|nr:hypothetical protein Bca52824_029163 [Brassica carinata]